MSRYLPVENLLDGFCCVIWYGSDSLPDSSRRPRPGIVDSVPSARFPNRVHKFTPRLAKTHDPLGWSTTCLTAEPILKPTTSLLGHGGCGIYCPIGRLGATVIGQGGQPLRSLPGVEVLRPTRTTGIFVPLDWATCRGMPALYSWLLLNAVHTGSGATGVTVRWVGGKSAAARTSAKPCACGVNSSAPSTAGRFR